MKYTATLIAAGAGVVSAFPNAVLPRASDPAPNNPWQAPGSGDVRAPCPGLNTLANHGYLPRNGKDISVPMVVKAFKDGFNMGSDIVTSAAGSALSVCQAVTGKACTAFNLDQLNTPHTFEHDASFTRQDFNFGLGNNHDFNQDVFNTVLDVWKDTDIIDYSYANAARLMRIAACKQADKPGWFTESDGTQLTEISFFMGTMGTPQDGNARKDWVTYWWTHERLPFELGWAADQRPEHNQSTINTMINNIINAPAPKPKLSNNASSSSSAAASSASAASSGSAAAASHSSSASASAAAVSSAASSDKPRVTLPAGYGFNTESSSVKIVPTTSPGAERCTLPEGWTFTSAGSTSLVAYKPSSVPAAATSTSAKPAEATSSVATRPTGFSSFPVAANNTAKPTATTTFLTTSIAYVTTEITVTSCASTITDCPAESRTPMVITKTLSEFTTICPVTATMRPSESASSPAPAVESSSSSSAKPAETTTATEEQKTTTASPTEQVPATTTTAAPATTTFLTMSVAYVTTEITVTSCAPSVTNCPAESKTPMVITKTLSEFTTICPVTATMVPQASSSSLQTSAAPAPAPATTTTAAPAFSYPAQTITYTFVSGDVVTVPCSSTAAAAASTTPAAPTTPTTSAAPKLPNPYYTSVPVESFPSVPATIVSQYSATTGVYAAPTYAPQYTESGSVAVASATAGNAAPAPAAPSAPAGAPPAAAATSVAAGGYGGAVPPPASASIVAASSQTVSSAPIQTAAAASARGVSGALAGLAVLAMLL